MNHEHNSTLLVFLIASAFLFFLVVISVMQYKEWRKHIRKGYKWGFWDFFFLGNSSGLVIMFLMICTTIMFTMFTVVALN